MAQPVNKTPLLPRASGSKEPSALARFDADLSRALFQELTSHAFRINGSFQKDGSEPMEGPLDMAGHPILNADFNADWSGGPLAVANGGTGATNANGARSNLGTNDAANLTTGTLSNARLDNNVDISNSLSVAGIVTLQNVAGEFIHINRAAASFNANIRYQTSAGNVFAGNADGTTFAIGGNANLSTVGNRWFDVSSTSVRFLQSEIYRRANILGAVSQSGGVPTGAIIQRGSNSNGEFVRFADGTQICTMAITVTNQALNNAYGSLFQGSRTWIFPASFAARPSVSCSEFRWGTGASWGAVGSEPTTSGVVLRGIDSISRASGTDVNISAIAIGRWF